MTESSQSPKQGCGTIFQPFFEGFVIYRSTGAARESEQRVAPAGLDTERVLILIKAGCLYENPVRKIRGQASHSQSLDSVTLR